MLAIAIGLSIEVMLGHMAIANAVLLDYESTREFGRAALPYFSVLLESRVSVAAMAGAMVFTWCLPWARVDAWVSWQPVLNAMCYAGAGCLAWLAGAALSPIGHGLLLAGATSGVGLLAIALVQLLDNDAILRHATLASVATWLLASRARGLVLGGAAAIYLLILRPALYEVLWFAALYEYIAVLALMAAAALFVLGLLRRGVESEGESGHDPAAWLHHEQTLESKDDPRAELVSALRQRFVDFGEWKPLWTYLMSLLYQNGASQEGMAYVCGPLRSSAVSSKAFRFLQRSNLRRLTRAAALATALRRMGSALADRPGHDQPLDEEAVREAAALFINSGTGVERLAIALTVAHCRQGLDLDSAIDHWFPLLNTPDPASIRFNLPWTSRSARLRDRQQRIHFVDEAVTMILGVSTIARDMNAPESLAALVGSPGTGSV
jgi:hypothetical protein